MTEPDPQHVERLAEAIETRLRQLGLTDRTIRRRRKATRAQIAAHLSRKDTP